MMATIFDRLNNTVLTLAIAIAMIAAWQVGRWLGHSFARKGRPKSSKFDDASLALATLLIAFSFAASIAKHDERRLAVVADSNAIGDFYTCAGLLKEPTRTELQSVIQQYAQLRLDSARSELDNAALNKILLRFDRMQSQMAQLAGRAITEGTPIAASLTNQLNAISSNQAARLAAIGDRLPPSIVVLLVASVIVSAFLIGREQGNADTYEVTGSLCFIVLASIAIFVILDLNQPQHGSIRVDQEPIERLVSSIRIDLNSRTSPRSIDAAGSSKANISLPLHAAEPPLRRQR
ncbi:MAG: hypothetical protein ACREQ4_18340 [Candidatus Binataceae bacterium]